MRRVKGFTLVEIAVVLVIAALVTAAIATIAGSLLAQQRLQITNARLAGVDAALLQFVMQQRRLPCPTDAPSLTGTELANAGGCSTNQAMGVVPWVTLGLPQSEVVDGWGRLITYRVDPILAVTEGMNMSQCDPAGGGTAVGGSQLCNSPCTAAAIATCTPPTAFLAGKGLQVRNLANAVLTIPTPNTAAAYVLISHGETGGGGYLPSGQLFVGTTPDGPSETVNRADQPYTAGTSFYVENERSEAAGNHFDDILFRSTILSVITRAGLGPRAHS